MNKLKLEYRKASELAKNVKNWRVHPENQRQAFNDFFNRVGWAGALLLNEVTDTLVDGHMRRDEFFDSDVLVPVLVGNWSEEQENEILTFLNPMGGMAKSDNEKLIALEHLVSSDSAALAELAASIAEEHGLLDELDVPNFEPVGVEEQSNLSTLKEVLCPHCGKNINDETSS